jgi:hypothetical protein
MAIEVLMPTPTASQVVNPILPVANAQIGGERITAASHATEVVPRVIAMVQTATVEVTVVEVAGASANEQVQKDVGGA